jgi:polygalacturonase
LVLLPQILCAFLVVAASSGTAAARRHVPPEAGPAGEQSTYLAPTCREHTASLTDFGGVGDGTTSNTAAFQKAVAHLSQYSGEGGGGSMLYVPAGKWLTAPFNLTSHFTLFLHADAVILASQVRTIHHHQLIPCSFHGFLNSDAEERKLKEFSRRVLATGHHRVAGHRSPAFLR